MNGFIDPITGGADPRSIHTHTTIYIISVYVVPDTEVQARLADSGNTTAVNNEVRQYLYKTFSSVSVECVECVQDIQLGEEEGV